METKSDEEICLFVRDEQSGRFLFNAKALEALGMNPVEAEQRGYPLKERSALAETVPGRLVSATATLGPPAMPASPIPFGLVSRYDYRHDQRRDKHDH